MLYGSEMQYLKEHEKAILRVMRRAIVRAKCNWKIVGRKTTGEQINMLRLKETINKWAKADGVDIC